MTRLATSAPGALLDQLFEQAGSGLCLVAPDGTVLRANAEWLRSTGLASAAVLGEDIAAVFPDVRDVAHALVARARAGETVEVPPHPHAMGDRTIWWEGRIAPVALDSGTGLLITARDVTGEQAGGDVAPGGESSRRAYETRYRTLFETLHESIMIYSVVRDAVGDVTDWIVRDANRVSLDVLGTTLDALVGRRATEIFGEDAMQRYLAVSRHVLARQRGHSSEVEFAWNGRSYRAGLFPLAADTIVLASVDVTDRVRAERALRESEARLRAAVESFPTPFVIHGDDGRIVYANAATAAAAGRPISEILGCRGEELFPPDICAEFAPHRERAIVTGEPQTFEWSEPAAYGGRRLALTYVPVRGGDGTVQQVLALTHDVTERARAENALRERERDLAARAAELEAVLDAVPAAVFITRERDARHMVGNRVCFEMLRLERGTNVSKSAPIGERPGSIRVLKGGREVAPETLPVQVAAATGEPVRGDEFEIAFADGSTRVLFGNAAPLLDPDGRPRGAVGTFVDITERKRTEEELERASRQKDEFLATLAHELRNPLGAISNAAHLLRLRLAQGHDVSRPLTILDRQVRNCARMLDDLLDVSRITRGKITLRPETVRLDALVASAVEGQRVFLEGAGHAIDVRLPADPIVLDADGTRLEQVLANLVNNAAKYTPPGGHIQLAAELQGRVVELRVRDDGAGIPEDLLPRVFDLFTQGDQSLARSQGGLGLGLTLVRNLVELHGGTVEARSDGPGRGTEIVVRLPARAGGRAPADAGAPPPSPAERPLRILVAEDVPDVAETFAEALRRLGHEVTVAVDGPAALAAAHGATPELVLLDLGLPGMDGYEVARRMRVELGPAAPVLVAVTGYGRDEDRARSQAAGFAAHLAKPVPLDHLGPLVADLTRARAP